MGKSKDLPWMQFYTQDWMGDAGLRMCSIAARGLWMDMLCIMHDAEPYGHLVINGHALNDRQLAVIAGITEDELVTLKSELEVSGVYSVSSKGVIYSRRMVKDEKKRRKNQKNGKKGGNPSLSKQREKSKSVNPKDNTGDKPQRPEARDQRKKEKLIKEKKDGDDVLWFDLRAIQLTKGEFMEWEQQYPHIPDLRDVLIKQAKFLPGRCDSWRAVTEKWLDAQNRQYAGQND